MREHGYAGGLAKSLGSSGCVLENFVKVDLWDSFEKYVKREYNSISSEGRGKG